MVAGMPTSASMPPRFSAAASRIAVELRAAETAFELEHDAADAAVGDEQVVATADDGDGQLLAFREQQRVADVVDVLRHDENVRGSADAQRRVEAEHLLEADFTPDLS